MWTRCASALVAAAIVVVIGTEVVRSIVHRRRAARDGLGGSQDIAMWGTFLGWALLIAAALCSVVGMLV